MQNSRFKEEQMVATLKVHEGGAATGELCQRLGVSEQALYRSPPPDDRRYETQLSRVLKKGDEV